jgi:hypothetical protein
MWMLDFARATVSANASNTRSVYEARSVSGVERDTQTLGERLIESFARGRYLGTEPGTRNASYQDMNGRALKIVGTAFLFVIAPKLTEAGADWREFQPPGQTFSIKMPAEITQSRRPTRTIIGSVNTDVWTASYGLTRLSVSRTHLPRLATWFTSTDGLYEKAVNKMLEELGAELGRIDEVERGPFERQIFYRVPAGNGRPLRSGRALIAVRDRTIVVINGLATPNEALSLDEFFKGLSTKQAIARGPRS